MMQNDEFQAILRDGGRCTQDQMKRMSGDQLKAMAGAIYEARSPAEFLSSDEQQVIQDWLLSLDAAPSWRQAWKSSRLYEDYVVWCQSKGVVVTNAVSWGAVLVRSGYPGYQKGGQRKRRLYRKETNRVEG